MAELKTRLEHIWEWRALPDGSSVRLLPHAVTAALAKTLGLHPGEVDRAALDMDILPERYLRQLHGLSVADQRTLCNARVALVGLGGLGGHVLEQLARAGVGFIRAADGDGFEPSNLNRQLLSSQLALGRQKAEVAVTRAAEINPAVALVACPRMLDEDGMARLLQGADLAIDALGGLDDRPALRRAARAAGIPLVTAAVAGETGYVAVAWPDMDGVSDLLARSHGNAGGAENALGTPAWTVALAASLEVQLAVRCLLGKATPDQPALLFDLADYSFTPVRL